jgi:exopolyphosphatase/guanosine-5'-triphosphate,3'-diphosphate pyrophosphatase
LRRYAIICKRHQARVRAVGTSALREAKNRDDIIRRVKREAGLELEAISGKEEARLMCLGVLSGRPPKARSLCLDIGGGSTEVAGAIGDQPSKLWSVAIGSVRLTEIFKSHGEVSPKQLRLLREFAREAVADSLPPGIRGFPRVALGSSGSIRAIIASAAAEGTAHATAEQISHVVEKLARMDPDERHKRFEARRADVIVAGAVILEALAHHLSLHAVTAVDRGLRHGVLVDLVRRRFRDADDSSLIDAARTMGRRFLLRRGPRHAGGETGHGDVRPIGGTASLALGGAAVSRSRGGTARHRPLGELPEASPPYRVPWFATATFPALPIVNATSWRASPASIAAVPLICTIPPWRA